MSFFFVLENINGRSTLYKYIGRELEIFMKEFMLLYVDGIALLAESVEDLQRKLDSLGNYCDIGKRSLT